MKTSRALFTLFAALILPLTSLAADATVASVKNKAVTMTPSGTREPVTIGQALESGTVVETGDGSAVSITLPDGNSITLGANSRVRIRFTNGILRLTLFRGVISGKFPTGATVTTPGGIARVGGSNSAIQYAATTPGSGTLTVAAGNKTVPITISDGKTTRTVAPGGTLEIASNGGSTTPGILSPEAMANLAQGLSPFGIPQNNLEENTRRGTPAQVPPPAKPDTTKITKISPNGE